jgi:hypothetical protein
MYKRKVLAYGGFLLLLLIGNANLAIAQSTTFTYQGRLTNAGNPANGNYDLQFELYDALSGGAQVGPTLTHNPVAVNAGVFTVALDFGAGVFDGAERYLEIGVRTAGSSILYTILSPRQAITSTPYSMRSLNATAADGLSVACVNCVTSNQIESVDGSQVTGAIPVESVPLGSGNYIQNATALRRAGKSALQQAASFSVDGDGAIGGQLTVNGQVGIGTDSPATKLEVFTPINQYGFMHTGQILVSLPRVKLATYVGANQNGTASGGWLGTVSDDSLHFFTNSGLGSMTITPAGNVGIGTFNPTAKLHVAGTARMGVVEITSGSDLAEHFEVVEGAQPGLVVAIDARHTGKLTLARGAYNRRVAGVISGAKNLSPGMVLPDLTASEKSQPIALSGRVWVYCDATNHPIKPGDLLTSSETPGHAMKVRNYTKAQGAIIGKAMTGLRAGKGLVLVLVSLQ